MKKEIIISILAAAALCGCQKEEQSIPDSNQKPFIATIDDNFSGPETKTSLDSQGNVLWKQGDQISIFAGSTINEQWQVTDASDGKTAAGLNKVSGAGFNAGGEIDNNAAFYPYSSENTIAKSEDGYVIEAVLPSGQNYAEASFGNGAFPMAAVTSSTTDMNLKFKNILGGLKLQLKGTATIASISISGNNDEILCGAANVAASVSGKPSINLTDGSAKTVTLNCGDGVQLDADAATPFVIALPPMTMTGGFTVTVTDTEGKQMEIKTTKSQTITRSSILKMPVVTYEGVLDYVPFEDANFKAYCVENFDTDGDGEISSEEALAVTVMSFDTNGMKNLEGVEYFQNLQYLNCSLTYYRGSRGAADDIWHNYDSNNVEVFGLESLDVSKNTSLTYLSCRYNQLTSLDVSHNTALTSLDCDGNQLPSLDVSKNTALTTLYCGGNQLTSLDLSKNTALTSLNCYNNQLTSLDLSKNTALNDLEIGENQFTSFDVSKNTALTFLSCRENFLRSLDVSKNTALTRLECYANSLTSLDVSNNTALTSLDCAVNHLTSLDVSKNTALAWLGCSYNRLACLDVSNNATLYSLDCSNNQLTSLDVSGCTALTSLSCWNNPYLTEIWFSKDQTIPSSFTYDTNIATIKRYGEPDAVDLGLSVKWATCNLGASSPEEYGDYYAWGETEIDLDFGWNYYVWAITGTYRMSKYCTDYTYGTVDNKTVLDLEDDVAHATLGGDWRMPTNAELIELVNNCTWTWTTQNNVNGYLVSSKTNSNSIFLPAAGHSLSYQVGSYGRYWSSTLYTGNEQFSYGLQFNISSVSHSSVLERYQGLSIRAVCKQ